MLTEKNHQNYLDTEKHAKLEAEVKKREAQIQRSQTILKIEKGILEHRSRILNAQVEINDVRRKLIEIREQMYELTEFQNVKHVVSASDDSFSLWITAQQLSKQTLLKIYNFI